MAPIYSPTPSGGPESKDEAPVEPLPAAPAALGRISKPKRTPPPVKRRRRRMSRGALITSITVPVIIMLVVGSSVIYTRWADARDHTQAPQLAARADLSSLGDTIVAKPFNAKGQTMLQHGSMRIFRADYGQGQALIGLDLTSSTGYPAWISPLPEELETEDLSCAITDGVLDCGEGVRVSVSGGTNDAKARIISGATQEASAPPTEAAGGQSAEGTGSTIRLGQSAATKDAPILSDTGTLTTADGKSIEGLSFDPLAPVWAVQSEAPRRLGPVRLPGGSSIWLVSDGTTLAAIKGRKVMWTRTLPEGSAQLNSLGGESTPLWSASGSSLLIAQPDGIVSINAAEGTTQWQVATPVTSWVSVPGSVVVFNGTSISLLSSETGAKQSPPAKDVPQPLTQEQLGNRTLSLPAECPVGAQDGESGTWSAEMSGGVAGDAQAGPSASITAAAPGVSAGQPITIASLSCSSEQGSGDVVAAYAADGSLLGSIPMESLTGLGSLSRVSIDELRVVGQTVLFRVPGILIAGDSSCEGCSGNGAATVTAQWNGKGFTIADTLYHTPAGESRIPDTAEVQAFYDAVANQDYATAGEHADEKLLKSLSTPRGEGTQIASASDTIRSAQFPPGGVVTGCFMAGPAADGVTPVPGGVVKYAEFEGGDVVCPVTSEDPGHPWMSPAPDENGTVVYQVWLVLKGLPDGTFEVTAFGPPLPDPKPTTPTPSPTPKEGEGSEGGEQGDQADSAQSPEPTPQEG
ncbi:hypothetical protein ACSL103130_02780 [Actinomyces slackii]|uniref:Uncharacterized protein n=1 Tax=Actinomyces slackii TaxID=52774 RepID=A0A3S4U2Y8_9ACTO|nr:hypothetical protein [Actinomyces slackii]VEG75223.1 Uncharacterised protein [Actinomyces slackii]